MRKYINKISKVCLFAAAVLTLSLGSCKENFTELDPLASLCESTAFATPANIELVANGVYQAVAVGFYNGGAGRGYPFGAAAIQQGEMRGQDMMNVQRSEEHTS